MMNTKRHEWKCVAVLALAAAVSTTVACQAGNVPVPNYARVCEPVVKPAFLPLPIGASSRKVGCATGPSLPATASRDIWTSGTRHLRTAGKGFRSRGPAPIRRAPAGPSNNRPTGWTGRSAWASSCTTTRLVKKICARLDPVVEGVHKAEAGTSFIYWKKGYQPQGFDSWAHSQMGRALAALYQGTGDKRVLDALVKVYAEYAGTMGHVRFSRRDRPVQSGRHAGDVFVQRRPADPGTRAPRHRPAGRGEGVPGLGSGPTVPGHMDIIYEDIRLPAIVYPWTGDRHLLRATLGAWRWLDEKHMQPYGVASGEEYASGIGPFRKTETCDVTSMLMSAAWLYRIQGDGNWGDRMERAFFNAGAAPVARDFQTMCYYQSPNRLRSDSLPAGPTALSGAERHSVQPPGLSPGAVLCRRGQPHHSQLHHPHVDGDARQRAGGDLVRALHGLRAGGRRRAGEDQHDDGLSVRRNDPHAGGAGQRTRRSRSTSAFPAGARMPGSA